METNRGTPIGDIERSAILAIDIGGTNLRAAVFDPDLSIRGQALTLAAEGVDAVIRRLHDLAITVVPPSLTLTGIAVATAGQVDFESGIIVDATDNLPGFRGLDLASRLDEWFADPPPILVENDVNAALAAEARLHPSAHALAMIALGTGVGGALMVNGKLFRGANHFAGEFGHLILHPNGRLCNCGQTGCLEQYISGPGLLATGRLYCPQLRDTRALFEADTHGEPWAETALRHFGQDLALALTSLVNILDPDRIVLAGGLAATRSHWETFLTATLTTVSRKPIPLVFSPFGGDSALYGAVELFRSRHRAPSKVCQRPLWR